MKQFLIILSFLLIIYIRFLNYLLFCSFSTLFSIFYCFLIYLKSIDYLIFCYWLFSKVNGLPLAEVGEKEWFTAEFLERPRRNLVRNDSLLVFSSRDINLLCLFRRPSLRLCFTSQFEGIFWFLAGEEGLTLYYRLLSWSSTLNAWIENSSVSPCFVAFLIGVTTFDCKLENPPFSLNFNVTYLSFWVLIFNWFFLNDEVLLDVYESKFQIWNLCYRYYSKLSDLLMSGRL